MLETIKKLDSKIRHAFILAKRDIYDLRAAIKMQQDVIKKLSESQKILLIKIERLESKKTTNTVTTKTVRINKTFVGAKTTLRVHSEDCPFGKNINPKNRVKFRTKTKAFNEAGCPTIRKT